MNPVSSGLDILEVYAFMGWAMSKYPDEILAMAKVYHAERHLGTDYEAIEREHLGYAEKRTGIYAPSRSNGG